jgi:phospholipid/cholesterol/gamma-HCH transport system ATP-binding protein
LKHRAAEETYAILVFTLKDPDTLVAGLGSEAAQETIRCLGTFIEKHFGSIGGFSTRLDVNEFVTVLPYSDLKEAEAILKDFTEDFQEQGIREILSCAQSKTYPESCAEFTVLAGISQGQPSGGIDAIIASAKNQQKEIYRFLCKGQGVDQ